jgi:hypothetical protein
MVALFDLALGLGCGCCNPFADQLPDIVCYRCKKVLYTTREQGVEAATPPAQSPKDDLDLTPRG